MKMTTDLGAGLGAVHDGVAAVDHPLVSHAVHALLGEVIT